jgi:CBS domain containing-hemolysin-like protein
MEDIIEALLQEDIQDEHDIERELDIGKDFSKQNSMLLFANCPTLTEITKEERLAS